MYIGIDLGGTNIAAGLVSEDGKILKQASTPTMNERDAIEIVKESGCSLSLVEEENKYITEDCSSYLEFKINDYGKLGFDVYKITKR